MGLHVLDTLYNYCALKVYVYTVISKVIYQEIILNYKYCIVLV